MMDKYLPSTGDKAGNISHRTKVVNADTIYPALNLKVLIVGDCFRAGAIAMFAEAACRPATSIEDADLICFLGGEDVDPQLYGERAMSGTYFNARRDEAEIEVFTKALSLGKPMFGICRGMQFLGVMNGNKLWQHVDNHAIGGTHPITDIQTGEIVMASSMHHQMVIENESTFPLAYATGRAKRYNSPSHTLQSDVYNDLEACIFPNINSIAVQGHPEVGGTPHYTAWCLTKVEEFLDELALLGDNSKDRIDETVLPPKIVN